MNTSAAERRLEEISAIIQQPMLPTLLRLSAPNLLTIVANTVTLTVDAYWAGRLGTESLAAFGIVFPIMFLIIAIATNGIGGGAGATVARALGGNRSDAAGTLASHALLIALVASLISAAALLGGGPWLYAKLGARGGALQLAIGLSNILFAITPLTWLFCMFNALIRAGGNMKLPALMIAVGSVVHMLATPLFIFGLWWIPPFGIRGIAIAYLVFHGLACAVLGAYLARGKAGFKLLANHLQFNRFWEILRIGLPAALVPTITLASTWIFTNLLSRYGTAAIAAYGLVARLEYVQTVLVTTVGAPLVFVVGASFGAGQQRRGLRWAWAGAAMAGTVSGVIGVAVAIYPPLWLSFFTTDPAVYSIGAQYLHIVGPTYAAYSAGIAMYFASQGAGRVLWATLGGVLRLLIGASFGAFAVVQWDIGLGALFIIIAVSFVAFGVVVVGAVQFGGWQGKATSN